jgi:gluconolactonase
MIVEDFPQFEVIAEGLAFPEGPVAMADGSVIVTEVLGGRLTRCWGNGRKETVASMAGGPNGLAVGPDGALYLCNSGGVNAETFRWNTGPGNEGRIERIDTATGTIERFCDSCDGLGLSSPNDLVFDVNGDLWFTNLGKMYDNVHEYGAVFHVSGNGQKIRCIDRSPHAYNGIGLSPDGGTVYVADTFSARLYAFDSDPAAPKGANQRLIGTAPGMVHLDSMAVTAAGNICVGRNVQGGIATFTPDGAVSTVAFPDHYCTNIAFGGADMRDAYITLSGTGRLIRVRWPEPGLRLHFNA